MLELIANISLIVSAVAMVALAYVTYRSVSIMKKEHDQKNRPYVWMTGYPRLETEGDNLVVYVNIMNGGSLPACITDSGITLNSEHSLDNNPVIMTVFPDPQGFHECNAKFKRASVVRENRQFNMELEVNYSTTGNSSRSYHYILRYLLVTTEERDGSFSIITPGSRILECTST